MFVLIAIVVQVGINEILIGATAIELLHKTFVDF
jgi:hypothetical protein